MDQATDYRRYADRRFDFYLGNGVIAAPGSEATDPKNQTKAELLYNTMNNLSSMPSLSHIAVHPIKALKPVGLEQVSITGIGGIAGDRAYAIVDENGDYMNGKRTTDVYRLDTEFDLDAKRVKLRVRGEDSMQEFHLEKDREAFEAWLTEFFGVRVELESGLGGSLTDSVVYGDGTEAGPTLVSQATVREVASWYEEIDPEEMRVRLRPNLVVEGVPPFWEDQLVSGGGKRLQIGDVTLEGVVPVPRCVVPSHDPKTGDTYEGFRETFIQKREETLPEWVGKDTFDGNLFSLTVVMRVPQSERDGELRVGDSVQLIDATTAK